MAISKDSAAVKPGPRYKPYPKYKDSGVEWLGEIPKHWDTKRLKHLAVLNPESLPEDTDPTLEMVYVDIGGVNSLGCIVESERLTFTSAPSRARRLVRNGDVIVSTVRTYLRAIAPISDPDPGMVVSTGFAVVRPEDGLTTDYAAYALRAPYFVERVVANSKGVSFPAINESEMATYELVVPSETEQYAIAAFLDRETAKIDALEAKKEQLIELLQEKRAALITQAVTKGLPSTGSGQAAPTVLMKNSGIDWLGKIPAHWDTRRLKLLASHITSGSRGWAEYYSDEGPVFLRIGNLKRTSIDLDLHDIQRVGPPLGAEGQRTKVRSGDVLLSITAFIGSVGVAPDNIEETYVNQHIALARPTLGQAKPRWLAYCLLSQVGQKQFQTLLYGGTKEGLGLEDVKNLVVLLPSPTEQEEITVYMDSETAKVDALIAKVREGTERLKELRTALISAAVTGKIDVRGAVA